MLEMILMLGLSDQADKLWSKEKPTITHWILAIRHISAELEYGAPYFWLTFVWTRENIIQINKFNIKQ